MSAAAVHGSPFYHSPSSFSVLLEQRANQCVPGTPEMFLSETTLGQTVPELPHLHTGGGQANNGYSGSPLLRQMLNRSGGRKRSLDSDHVSLAKRLRHDISIVPTSLVVLRRKPQITNTEGDQSVPRRPVSVPKPSSAVENTPTKPTPNSPCSANSPDNDLHWFDLLVDSKKLTLPEE